jgi:hypothetical protein
MHNVDLRHDLAETAPQGPGRSEKGRPASGQRLDLECGVLLPGLWSISPIRRNDSYLMSSARHDPGHPQTGGTSTTPQWVEVSDHMQYLQHGLSGHNIIRRARDHD